MLPREVEMVLKRTGLPGGEVLSSLSSPEDRIPRYIKTHLYLFLPLVANTANDIS